MYLFNEGCQHDCESAASTKPKTNSENNKH